MKLNIIEFIFALIFTAKIIKIGTIPQSFLTLILYFLVYVFISVVVKYLTSKEMQEDIAAKIYISKNKKAIAEAEKEAKKIIKDES